MFHWFKYYKYFVWFKMLSLESKFNSQSKLKYLFPFVFNDKNTLKVESLNMILFCMVPNPDLYMWYL